MKTFSKFFRKSCRYKYIEDVAPYRIAHLGFGDNPEYGADGGNDTEDKIFLLSIGEVLHYFDPDPEAKDPARRAKVTAYAEAQGGFVYNEAEYGQYDTTEYDGNDLWWLRSPGIIDSTAAYVFLDGVLDLGGFGVHAGDVGARPAFWLNPESATATPETTPALKATLTPTPEATPTPTPKPTATPTPTPSSTPTPKPTKAPSGTAFTPSGVGGRVTFTGNTVDISKAKVGDTVRFGSYEQDNNKSNGAEAIEWLVLDEQDGKLLLLSKDALDAKPYSVYNEKWEDVTWETCTLRNWLNNEFYKEAFSQAEQGRIATTKVRNEDNPEYGTDGGNDTEDKVFLLSIGEVLHYFDPDQYAKDPARRAKVTAYAEAQGGFVYNEAEWGWHDTTEYDGNGQWWLRSPGDDDGNAAEVNQGGGLYMFGSLVYVEDGGVRPAFWLNPES